MSHAGHGNKGDADTRKDVKKFNQEYEKIDFSKPVNTRGFKMRVNGKEVAVGNGMTYLP